MSPDPQIRHVIAGRLMESGALSLECRTGREAGSGNREQRICLTSPARRLGAALWLAFLDLLRADLGEDGAQAFVLHDGALGDLRQLVEEGVGQVHALVPDDKPAV